MKWVLIGLGVYVGIGVTSTLVRRANAQARLDAMPKTPDMMSAKIAPTSPGEFVFESLAWPIVPFIGGK